MGRGVPSPSRDSGIDSTEWEPKLKNYPHFDKPISRKKILALVTDPRRVAENTFFPFLLFRQRWQPFRSRAAGKPEPKVRELRYASRRDSYIYAYYRHALVQKYEERLNELGLSNSILAYRKIKDRNGRGKSNIEFARDAFDYIAELGECAVVTLDISAFFESIDHSRLYDEWCATLGCEALPPDHNALFRSLTRYAVVDRNEAYLRLGYAELNRDRVVFTQPPQNVSIQLCNTRDFRELICGNGQAGPSLIKKNRNHYGIPQGSPISDLLANLYLTRFDTEINQYVERLGGRYYRYSDDILLAIPGAAAAAMSARAFVMAEIRLHGVQLKIKTEKTGVCCFTKQNSYQHVMGAQGRNGLEYLGFRFDGQRVYLRDGTVSRLYRKVTGSLRASVRGHIARYPGRAKARLVDSFPYATFMQRYGRVRDFDLNSSYKDWTFWSYTRRAIAAFGERQRISQQLKSYRLLIRVRVTRFVSEELDSS